jgi:hypothetical protein
MFDFPDFDLVSFLLGMVVAYMILYAYYTYSMSEGFGSDPNTWSPYPEQMTSGKEWSDGDHSAGPRNFA